MLPRDQRAPDAAPCLPPGASARNVAPTGKVSSLPGSVAMDHRPCAGKSFGPPETDVEVRRAWLKGYERGWRQFGQRTVLSPVGRNPESCRFGARSRECDNCHKSRIAATYCFVAMVILSHPFLAELGGRI